jgi:hypothetical protein
MHLHDPAVDVVATLRAGYRNAMVESHECRINGLHVGIVVSRHVEQRHGEAGDQEFEKVERQVAARDDEIRSQGLKLVTV